MSDFYTREHLGNLFGIKGPAYGPKGHLGVDFHNMAAGTSIPAWRAGRAVERGYSTNLGYYLIVKTDIGYVGYHHMQSQAFAPVEAQIAVGDIIGRLGYTGKLVIPAGPAGTHLHTTLADSALVGGQDVHDPLPYILGTVTAGGSSRPLDNEPDNDPSTPEQENDDMPDNSGFYYPRSTDGALVRLIVNTGSGFEHEYTLGGSELTDYDNQVATAFHSGSFAKISEAHASVIKAACAVVAK